MNFKNRIQYLSLKHNTKGELITNSSFSSPTSPDEFELNVVDLTEDLFWKNNDCNLKKINTQTDFVHLGNMLANSKKTKILILFPQNIDFTYNWTAKTPTQSEPLKNILGSVDSIISNSLKINKHTLKFENTKTVIDDSLISSNFYFSDGSYSILRSEHSEKATAINAGKYILTTLKIDSYDLLMKFLMITVFHKEKENIPKWVRLLNAFDDKLQKTKIETKEKMILLAQDEIQKSKKILEKNNRYKSILCTSGDELVDVVFEILEEVVEVDLSNFKDEKKEDVKFIIDDTTVIGEIKGVSKNIKNLYISQLEVHYQSYLDKLKESNIEEKVKAILIICHQRDKNIDARDVINDDQIELAKRNGSLIIETTTLLKLFEKFKNGEITGESVKEIIKSNTGLLQIKNLK